MSTLVDYDAYDYVNFDLFGVAQPANISQPALAQNDNYDYLWDLSTPFTTDPMPLEAGLDFQPVDDGPQPVDDDPQPVDNAATTIEAIDPALLLTTFTATGPTLASFPSLHTAHNGNYEAPGDGHGGQSSGGIASFDTLAAPHPAPSSPDYTTTSHPDFTTDTLLRSTGAPSRKRRISDSAAADHDASEAENVDPGNSTLVDRVKRQCRDVPALRSSNATRSPSVDASASPPPVPGNSNANAAVASGQAFIAIPTTKKYGCISDAFFAWLPDGKAECLYRGPSCKMQNGNHKPLKLGHVLAADRLYRHWISHERREAMDIATGQITLDAAHLVKTAADQSIVFANWPKCPNCRCKCEKAGKACTFMHHGRRFARTERLDKHTDEGKCK